jgi:hypothetical protein
MTAILILYNLHAQSKTQQQIQTIPHHLATYTEYKKLHYPCEWMWVWKYYNK